MNEDLHRAQAACSIELRHAVAYHFWRRSADHLKPHQQAGVRRPQLKQADNFAAKSLAAMAMARANVAAWATAVVGASDVANAMAAHTAAAKHAAVAEAVAVAAAGARAIAINQRRRGIYDDTRLLQPDKPWVVAAFEAAGAALPMSALDSWADSSLPTPPAPPVPPGFELAERVWMTEGQCEGKTRLSERCCVHRSSKYAVAAPLRCGERFCGHHHPNKYTGVRCAGMRKHGKGQCNIWSGACYADAAPLRRGSPYCHHHRVRCAGITRLGERCTVTSSSEHAHAAPLRQGEQFCTHHQPSKLQQPANEEHFELYECADCGELSAVPAGDQCLAHDCSISNNVNEDISDAEDDECERCSQLSSVCVCRGESQYTHAYHMQSLAAVTTAM